MEEVRWIISDTTNRSTDFQYEMLTWRREVVLDSVLLYYPKFVFTGIIKDNNLYHDSSRINSGVGVGVGDKSTGILSNNLKKT